MTAATILDTIVARKVEEVADRKAQRTEAQLLAEIDLQQPCRGFVDAIKRKIDGGEAAVIAEIKKASPSKGLIREDFFVSEIATSYQRGGAACLSVLTDVDFFQGADSYLQEASATVTLPVLRKDFVIDQYQITEARWLGADCILLIAAVLKPDHLAALYDHALSLGLDVLIEVHNADELAAILPIKPALVGVNNRNLHTFETSLETTFDLLAMMPSDAVVVTESGIHTSDDVAAMRGHDVNAFLVGESLMRADDPGRRLLELFN